MSLRVRLGAQPVAWRSLLLLPTSTGAGRALGWVARDLARMKVGLAFGGGSEKGYAHIGVWRGLARLGLPIDFLAGTSIGSAVAALVAPLPPG